MAGPTLRFLNTLAAAIVVLSACTIYAIAPYNRKQMGALHGVPDFSFTGDLYLFAMAGAYLSLLTAYYLFERQPEVSKSLRFLALTFTAVRTPSSALLLWRAPRERVAFLTTLLKGFFGPFMVMALMQHVVGGVMIGRDLFAGDGLGGLDFLAAFNSHGFWLAMKIILFVDVALFTIGYLVEMPALKNEIRSVDPTLIGWAAALLCYPPFNSVTGAVLGSTVNDFPQFDDPMTHLLLNVALLLLMAVYACASLALGLKASNLTHRGIVARGPYAVVRHPAYVCKNVAWWIGSAPLVSVAFSQSLFAGVAALASVIGWTLLYVLRAVTEEDHLRSVDGDYAAYAARVRYRFVPGLA